MVTALRSLLRWAHLKGALAADLAATVPAVACWRFSTVPKSIPARDVRASSAPLSTKKLRSRPARPRGPDADGTTRPSRWRSREPGSGRLRLGRRHGAGPRQGWAARRPPVAVRCRQGRRPVLAPWPPSMLVPESLRPRESTTTWLHNHGRNLYDREACTGARRTGPTMQGRAHSSPCARLLDAASRSDPHRDRTGPATPSSRHDDDLREGRSPGTTCSRSCMAGRQAMSTLCEGVEAYLSLRRRLGYKLDRSCSEAV